MAAKDQQHPLWAIDRQIINTLLSSEPNDMSLAEAARLRIRYNGFPGARDIQGDLDKVLKSWGMSEEELFAKTRDIHAQGQVYRQRNNQREDWV